MARNLVLETAATTHSLYLGAVPANRAPTVDAGANASVTLPGSASLAGTASDPDGDALTYAWSKVSGPGTVSFTNASALTTSASFSQAGTYVLRLTASDGTASAADDVTITAQAAQQALSGVTVTTNGSMGSAQTSCSVRAGGKVFVGYARDSGSFYAAQVDEATGAVEGESLIGTLGADRHMNPAMEVLPDGRIVAVYDDHGTARLRVSTNVHDVLGGWDTVRTPAGAEHLYVQPVVTGEGAGTERIYVFYTRHAESGNARVACFVSTDDRGASWSAETVFFTNAGDWVYMTARRSEATGRVLVCCTDDNPAQGPTSGHLLAYDPSDASWTSAAGAALTLPVAAGIATRFYDRAAHGDRDIEFMPMAYETASVIYVAMVTRNYTTDNRRFVRCVYDGSAWAYQTIAEGAGTLRNALVMPQSDPNVLFGIVETDGVQDVWRFNTTDDGASWPGTNITSGQLPAVTDPAFDIWNLHEIKHGTPAASPWALNRWDWPAPDDFDGNVYLYLGTGAQAVTGLDAYLDGIKWTLTPSPFS